MSPPAQPPGALTIHFRRAADYLALTKPELTLLSVFTATGAAYLASAEETSTILLGATFVGTALVGGACGALNQYVERGHDAMMRRTDRRPIPAGRITPRATMFFGVGLALAGLIVLALFTTTLATILAFGTIVTYLAIYTPLKRRTPFATIIGGIPGALPPLIGWSAVTGSVAMGGWALFFILFFWQMPHFLALAWMYRNDYARAGFRMLAVVDASGASSARQALVYSVALIAASAMPTLVGMTGIVYFAGAIILSLAFLFLAVRFLRQRSNTSARQLFFASLAYLPTLFFLLMIDRR